MLHMKCVEMWQGLLLKDEMRVDLCVSCRDKPTAKLLCEVAELINAHAAKG